MKRKYKKPELHPVRFGTENIVSGSSVSLENAACTEIIKNNGTLQIRGRTDEVVKIISFR